MFVKYDEAAANAAEVRVPAFQPGWYAARVTGFKEENAYGQGGKKLVIDFEVWQEQQRHAPTRTVRGHFCLQHPQPQARGMAHARLRDLGIAADRFDSMAGGTHVPQLAGRWVSVQLTHHDGKNQKGEPMTYNHINGYAKLDMRPRPTGPAAPTAGVPEGPTTTEAAYAEASQSYTGGAGFADAGPDAPPPEADEVDDVPF